MMLKAASRIMLTLLFIGVLTLAFNIQPTCAESRLTLETDKNVYILGENVKIILTNVGSETDWIGGYPAWTIFTYPKEEPVYPKIFATLLWWLEPGENDTVTWNQYNEYTQSFAEPGMYVIRDTKGWGLSTYFEIVALAPKEALEQLIKTVESWNLDKGIENSLTSKLQKAYRSLDRENQKAAICQLTAFIDKVETLRDKKLTIEQADQLIAEAQRIIDLIEG